MIKKNKIKLKKMIRVIDNSAWYCWTKLDYKKQYFM